MSDFLWDTLLAVPVVLVILWVLKGKLRQREQRPADFERLASELGLQFNATHMGVREGQAEPPEHATLRNTAVGKAGLAALAAMPVSSQFSIDGSFGGVDVRITLHQKSSDGAGGHATLLSAHMQRLPGLEGLALCRSYAVDRLLDRATGGQDIELGDAAFDESVRVRGAPSDAVRAWLADADVRASVLKYLTAYDTGRVDEHGVHLQLAGAVSDSARVRTALQSMTALSKALRRTSQATDLPAA